MINFFFRYGLDILLAISLLLLFITSAKTRAKKKKRVRFVGKRLLPATLVIWLIVCLLVPALFGSISHHARHLPQLLEAHKLRCYWQLAYLIPGVKPSRKDLQQAIDKTARQYTMHPDLIRAVVKVESSNNPLAISPVGACGLMQIMPDTYFAFGRGNPFAMNANLNVGTRYLRHLYRRYNGNIELALAAYNAGPGLVKRHGGVPPGSVRRYVDRVMWWYRKYKKK